MPYKISINAHQPDTQAAIIPDATNNSVGVISLNRIREIASEAGGIALKQIVQEDVVLGANTFDANPGDMMVLNNGSADGSNVTVQLPSASTPAMISIKNYAEVNALRAGPPSGETIENSDSNFTLPITARVCAVFVSDGVSNWILVSLYAPGD